MVSIPLYVFLFIFFGILAILGIFLIINLIHLIQTGSLSFVSFLVTFFILVFIVAILYAAWFLLQNTNWQTLVTIWNNEWITSKLYPTQF